MANSTTTRAASSAAVNVFISSFMKGGILQECQFATVGDVLTDHKIDVTQAVLDLEDESGESRRATPATKFREGDTLTIMKAKNKSGS